MMKNMSLKPDVYTYISVNVVIMCKYILVLYIILTYFLFIFFHKLSQKTYGNKDIKEIILNRICRMNCITPNMIMMYVPLSCSVKAAEPVTEPE